MRILQAGTYALLVGAMFLFGGLMLAQAIPGGLLGIAFGVVALLGAIWYLAD